MLLAQPKGKEATQPVEPRVHIAHDEKRFHSSFYDERSVYAQRASSKNGPSSLPAGAAQWHWECYLPLTARVQQVEKDRSCVELVRMLPPIATCPSHRQSDNVGASLSDASSMRSMSFALLWHRVHARSSRDAQALRCKVERNGMCTAINLPKFVLSVAQSVGRLSIEETVVVICRLLVRVVANFDFL